MKVASGPGLVDPGFVNAYPMNGAIIGVRPGGKLVRINAGSTSLFVEIGALGAAQSRELRSSRAVVGMKVEGRWVRIDCVDYDYRERVVAWLEQEAKVQTYEGDVGPILRWQIDAKPKLAKPRGAYLDIEADSRVPFSRKETARILCWSLRDLATSEEVATGLLEADEDEAEREELVQLWGALDAYDQVLAWNGDRYDFPMIVQRSAKRSVQFNPRRLLYLDHMKLFTRSNVMAAESGAEKQFVGLAEIAREQWEEGDPEVYRTKLDLDNSKTWEAWENATWCGGNPDCFACRTCLLKYCGHDTGLGCFIEKKSDYIARFESVCEICGVFVDSRAVNPQVQVEALLFSLARERDYRPKTRPPREEKKPNSQFDGALVMKPRGSGIQTDVHVADFASMYPSIIVSWNMSPETKRPGKPNPNDSRPVYLARVPWTSRDARPDGCAEANGVFFDQGEEGILPSGISRLVAMRKKYRDLKGVLPPKSPEWHAADRLDTASKISANQFFGVAGSPSSRFYDRDVGEAITQAGVALIQRTIVEAEKRFGFRVIYCDTDSIYVVGCTRAELDRFIEWCNAELYPEMLRDAGCARSTVKLEGEKGFRRIVWTAAKKYAGKLGYFKGAPADESTPPEIKGLEYKRGDAVKLARDMQWEAIELVLDAEATAESCVALVERWKRRCLEEPLELGDVVQSKRLSKALREYATKTKKDGTAAAPPPHVAIAKVLQKRGQDVGEGVKIEYFVADGSSSPKKYLPAGDWTGECDRHELWEGTVYPPTFRLLEAAFPGRPEWKEHAKTRPRRGRGRAAAEPASAVAPLAGRSRKPSPEGQGALF